MIVLGNCFASLLCNSLDRQTKTLSQTDKNTIKFIASHEPSGLRFACSNLRCMKKTTRIYVSPSLQQCNSDTLYS